MLSCIGRDSVRSGALPLPRRLEVPPCVASSIFWTPEPHARPHLRLPSLTEFHFSPATSSFSFDPYFTFCLFNIFVFHFPLFSLTLTTSWHQTCLAQSTYTLAWLSPEHLISLTRRHTIPYYTRRHKELQVYKYLHKY
jgi:hypothetical protein